MSLDLTRLEKLKELGGGAKQARCPACASEGLDKSGNHLRIWPDGKFGCAMYQGDHAHRQRIWELCGSDEPKPARFNVPVRIEPPSINCTELIRKWNELTLYSSIRDQADKLGVSPLALRCLGWVWSGEHWAVPMRSEWGDVCGIQFRYANGFKQTLRGSRVGYFIPECRTQSTAYISEGASDCAALLSLGLYSVGRYNCAQSGVKLGQYLRRNGVRDAVIIADNDVPGITGAEKLSHELSMHCCIYTPPTKDAREFLNMGGTRQLIESTVSNLIWRQP